MTRKQLESRTRDELVRLARERGLRGWKEMTKAALIESLSRPARKDPSHSAPASPLGLHRPGQSQPNGKRHADAAVLQNMRKKDLAQTAKEYCVAGWHSMSKDELIRAISNLKPADRNRNGASRRTMVSKAAPAAPRRTDVSNLPTMKETIERIRIAPPEKDLAAHHGRSGKEPRDRIVAMVRDPYWLHVCWEISTGAIRRTEAALGHDWYSANPILRLIDVTSEDTTTASESVVRDVQIHGGVNNWYLDVQNPPRSYRIDIGYLSARGRFFVLARSNIVTTPRPGGADPVDGHWRSVKEDFERIFARSGGNEESEEHGVLRGLFEERLRRPMSTGTLGSFGAGALGGVRKQDFHFQIDAELIVYGSTDPSAKVSLQGEPVPVRQDGSFTLRFGLPEGRLILPACAQTRDGIEERTIILAIERNTKELEPMIHDGQEI